MFLADGSFIGIPSRVVLAGWSTPITHMGLFIPARRIYVWLEKEYYDFIYDSAKSEAERLLSREENIKKRQKQL